VESTFAQLFGKRVHAQQIALQLARAMEDVAESDMGVESRPLAPDYYAIHLNPLTRKRLMEKQPELTQHLSNFMVELAGNAGYRLTSTPTVELVPNAELDTGAVVVRARHSRKRTSTTAVMQRVNLNTDQPAPVNPQLLVHGRQPILLQSEIINVGRSRDNHIVIDDGAVSRYHLQIRLRFGRYTLFDAQSQSGTFVNDVQIREHNLQTGDVIRIGNTRLVYMEDHQSHDGYTQTNPPIEPDSRS
jgi:hypothetical protein